MLRSHPKETHFQACKTTVSKNNLKPLLELKPVLVSAGIELILLFGFGFSMRRTLITLMFPVAAKQSRTSSSFPYSGNEPVYKSWEGAQPGR